MRLIALVKEVSGLEHKNEENKRAEIVIAYIPLLLARVTQEVYTCSVSHSLTMNKVRRLLQTLGNDPASTAKKEGPDLRVGWIISCVRSFELSSGLNFDIPHIEIFSVLGSAVKGIMISDRFSEGLVAHHLIRTPCYRSDANK